MDLTNDQPMPTVNSRPHIHDLVAADVMVRKQIGISRYGTALQTGNGRDMLRDVYEEILDSANYLRAAILEREIVRALLAYVEQHTGSLAFAYNDRHGWLVGLEFGEETEGSSMAAGAAYSTLPILTDALVDIARQIGIPVSEPEPVRKD